MHRCSGGLRGFDEHCFSASHAIGFHAMLTLTFRLMGQAAPPLSDKVQVCITKTDFNVRLANATDESIELGPGELCGFNVGTFAQKQLSPWATSVVFQCDLILIDTLWKYVVD